MVRMRWLGLLVFLWLPGAPPVIAQTITPPLFRCLFARGSAEIIPLCEDSARALRDYWSAGIVAGTPPAHLDVLGSATAAEARRDGSLAQRRAVAVASLLAGLGFARDRMTVEASPLEEPVVLMDPFGQPRCFFAPGSAELAPSCAAVLRGVAGWVAEHPAAGRARLELDINGFTDDREAHRGPPGLAARRAEAVVQALRDLGLATQRLNARGHGPEAALRPTDRPYGRARVVSIALVPAPITR